MRFERIDDKTIKCFISNEELDEFQIDYKDFIVRSEKAREVMQEIIEKAEEAVGYKPPKFAFDLQIMMVPDQGLLLTFSEKDPMDTKEGAKLMEYLKEMKQAMEKGLFPKLEEGTSETPNTTPQAKEQPKNQAADSQPAKPTKSIFVFDNIHSLMEYAAILPSTLRIHSELYVMNGVYYLYLEKGSASYERYSRACVQAMEFSFDFIADEQRLLHLKEHGECLIPEKAIKKLSM